MQIERDIELLKEAFGCGCDDATSTHVSVSPPNLQFRHDQRSSYLAKVSVWNKRRDYVEVHLEKLNAPNIFHAFCNKKGAYGGSQVDVWVKCTPGLRKLAFDCLRIRVTTINSDPREVQVLSVPLQLCPGFSWFSMPKVVAMPSISVGNVAEVSLTFPQVPEPEKFFVAVRSSKPHLSESLTITPLSGVLGSDFDAVSELVIRYKPTDYTTLVHVVQLHFPGVDAVPHEIVIFARAIPGIESERIKRETTILQNFMAMEQSSKAATERKRLPEPKLRFKPAPPAPPSSGGDEEEEEETDSPQPKTCSTVKNGDDLTTPAGVMRFLLRKGARSHENAKTVELTTPQEEKVHSQPDSKNEFHTTEKMRHKHGHSPLHHSHAPLDEDPTQNRDKFAEKSVHSHHRDQHEKEAGVNEEDEEDVPRTRGKGTKQKSLHRLGKLSKPNLNEGLFVDDEGRKETHNSSKIGQKRSKSVKQSKETRDEEEVEEEQVVHHNLSGHDSSDPSTPRHNHKVGGHHHATDALFVSPDHDAAYNSSTE
ncbi:hypothetical protein Fcan01_26284 [Folsomia candida]|uniref:Uncharacterized protein n=1 Tax=Folsomia candida TaxID=158441 RepID=A0A226D1Q7_FOLCA|nr:hypothetical protein Fcan01_26284 [Folsomia candida]